VGQKSDTPTIISRVYLLNTSACNNCTPTGIRQNFKVEAKEFVSLPN